MDDYYCDLLSEAKQELDPSRLMRMLGLPDSLGDLAAQGLNDFLKSTNGSESGEDYLQLALLCWKPVDVYPEGDPCFLKTE